MNGCLRLCSYVNVYPISDSFEAASHLILSALLPTVPTRQFKSSATSSRVSSHSHHILIFKASRRDWTCQERYRRKKDDKTQIWRQGRSGQRDSPPVSLANRPGQWLLYWSERSGLGQQDCLHPERAGIDCSGNWWSSGTIRLQGSTVRWESTLPAWLLIDGKIISAAY